VLCEKSSVVPKGMLGIYLITTSSCIYVAKPTREIWARFPISHILVFASFTHVSFKTCRLITVCETEEIPEDTRELLTLYRFKVTFVFYL